jgi:hypothetical protein
MALTDTEIQKIVFYLGWPSKTVDEGSTHYSKIFKDRINDVSAEGEVIVRNYIRKIEEMYERLESAACRLSTSQVDNLHINPMEVEKLHKLKCRYIKELSDFLDLPIMRTSCSSAKSLVV